MGAFADFQTAVYAALNGNAALNTIIGGPGKVFDDVPHGSESTSPTYPYVTLGDQTGAEAGTSDSDATDATITVHAWSRGAGRLQCLQMLDAIRDAVHNKSHFVSHGVLVFLLYQAHNTLKEADGETYHGVISFRGYYQYG